MLVYDQRKRRIAHREFVKRNGLAQNYDIEVSTQYREGVGLIGIDDEHTIQQGNLVPQLWICGGASGRGGHEARNVRRPPPDQRVRESTTGFRDKWDLFPVAAAQYSTASDGKIHDGSVACEAVSLQTGEDNPLDCDLFQSTPGPLNRTRPFDRAGSIG